MSLPAPYYCEDGITIYCGDCREIMPEGEADVMVTDPPYGMAYQSGYGAGWLPVAGDESPAIRDIALALWGDDRPAAVFGTWRIERPQRTRQLLVWDKSDAIGPGMGNLNMAFGSSHEEVYLLGEWPCREGFSRRPSVLRTSQGQGSRGGVVYLSGHPTAKPVGLLVRLLEVGPAGTVLDPFMGSGTTLVAAKQLGRKAVGIEIEERYCEVAVQRLAQGVLPLEAP